MSSHIGLIGAVIALLYSQICSTGNRVTQPVRDGVQLTLCACVVPVIGIIATPALLSCFGMAPLDQMGTWISESAGLMQREHQGRPDPRRFAVSPPIVTVCRVKVWQPLHDRPCLQEPRLRVSNAQLQPK